MLSFLLVVPDGYIRFFPLFCPAGTILPLPERTFCWLCIWTAIFCILPLSITSSIIYITSGEFDFYNLGFVGLGVIIGGIIGSILLKKINCINLLIYIKEVHYVE